MTATVESGEPATLESLGIDLLPLSQLKRLHQELGEYIARAPANIEPLTEAQLAELRHRVTEMDANPDDYITAEQVHEAQNLRWGWK